MAEDLKLKVQDRVKAMCPEYHKIPSGSSSFCISDATYDMDIALAGLDENIYTRITAYLAAHFCTVELFQWQQQNATDNFQDSVGGEVGDAKQGDVKVISYKDKKNEYFDANASSKASIVKWRSKLPPSRDILTGTSYGMEYLRLMKLYNVDSPFLLGNDLNEGLGRKPDEYVGSRYDKW